MDEYRLVNCEFHDRLEAWSTLRQPCQIIYRNAIDERIEIRDRIVDVYAAHQADFLKLSDGTEIRLDKIISVNGEPLAYASD
jgi:Rho-binding antiterminator